MRLNTRYRHHQRYSLKKGCAQLYTHPPFQAHLVTQVFTTTSIRQNQFLFKTGHTLLILKWAQHIITNTQRLRTYKNTELQDSEYCIQQEIGHVQDLLGENVEVDGIKEDGGVTWPSNQSGSSTECMFHRQHHNTQYFGACLQNC